MAEIATPNSRPSVSAIRCFASVVDRERDRTFIQDADEIGNVRIGTLAE